MSSVGDPLARVLRKRSKLPRVRRQEVYGAIDIAEENFTAEFKSKIRSIRFIPLT